MSLGSKSGQSICFQVWNQIWCPIKTFYVVVLWLARSPYGHKVLGSIPAIFSRVQSGHSKKDLNKGTSKLYLIGCCRWAFKIHFELICANLICLPDSAESWGDRERKKCPLPGGIWTRNFVITNKFKSWPSTFVWRPKVHSNDFVLPGPFPGTLETLPETL